MATPAPRQDPQVWSTREARDHLSAYLAETRRHGRATPVRYYGAQRRREAALVSAELMDELLELADDVAIAAEVAEREGDEVVTGTVDEFLAGAGITQEDLDQARATRG